METQTCNKSKRLKFLIEVEKEVLKAEAPKTKENPLLFLMIKNLD